MVNKMAKSIGHLITMNDEYLYSAAHGEMYSPLRVHDTTIQKLQDTLETERPDTQSCINEIYGVWYNGKFMLATKFNESTKCTCDIRKPSHFTKTEMCYKNLCNGKCRDAFMQKLAKNILPELYKNKQK